LLLKSPLFQQTIPCLSAICSTLVVVVVGVVAVVSDVVLFIIIIIIIATATFLQC
jgi:hypothetical protein